MRKILLSLLVIFLFSLYSFLQHKELFKTKVTSKIIFPNLIQNGSLSSSGITPTINNAQRIKYNNGEYTGVIADAFYGNIQIKTIIQGRKITDVQFLQYPNDRRTSIEINSQAMPYLKSEAIQAQNSNVDIISGATDTSIAFKQSLESALVQARK